MLEKRINKIIVLLSALNIVLSICTIALFKNKSNIAGLYRSQNSIDIEQINADYQQYRKIQRINNLYSQMNNKERIGQMFMVSITGTEVHEQTAALIEQYHVGAIVIMGNNIGSQQELPQFINDLQDISTTPILIATDQEGKDVVRIPWDDAYDISQPHIGIVNREDFAYETGKAHAQAIKDVGIMMNLAPVLDISLVERSSMSTRSLSSDPQKVARLGKEIIKAHHDINVIATAKHFPGIGRTAIDTHSQLPIIDISKQQLLQEELLPFQTAISSDIDVIMTGHVLYPQIDPDYPASLSKKITTDILRNELGFEGVILTDDLRMGALKDYPQKAVQAITAGADMLLIVDSFEHQVAFIEQVTQAVDNNEISQDQLEEHVKRIVELKIEYELYK